MIEEIRTVRTSTEYIALGVTVMIVGFVFVLSFIASLPILVLCKIAEAIANDPPLIGKIALSFVIAAVVLALSLFVFPLLWKLLGWWCLFITLGVILLLDRIQR